MDFFGIELDELEISKIGSWPKFLQIILLCFIGLSTLILGYFFVIRSKIDTYYVNQGKISEEIKLFADSQMKAANLADYEHEVKIVEQELENLYEQLPKQNELAGFLDDASQQAGITGLKFLSIQPIEPIHHTFYSEVGVNLSVSGHYGQFIEFVSNVANMKRLVTLHDFEIKSPSVDSNTTDNNQNVLVMTVLSKTYWSGG